jgi:hypothetical protein
VNFADPHGTYLVDAGGGLVLDCGYGGDSIYDGTCTGTDGGWGGDSGGGGGGCYGSELDFLGQPDPGCPAGNGGGGNDAPEPDCASAYTAAQLNFVTADYGASAQLASSTGVPSDWILGWGAQESGWGVTGITPTQGNYYGWHGAGNIKCPNGMNLQNNAGCFSSFYQSASTALTSTNNWFHYTFPGQKTASWHVSSASILASQIKSGASAGQAFQALANSGYKNDSSYGTTVAGLIITVDAIENCLRSKGVIR